MIIGVIAIALIIFFTWRAMKQQNGELHQKRYKPRKKLPAECQSLFHQAESCISVIANERSYQFVMDKVEEILRQQYEQYQYNKLKGYDDPYQQYYSDMFENQTHYKTQMWGIWYTRLALRKYVNGLASEGERMVLKNLDEKYKNILEDESCPESFLDAWEEYDALEKKKNQPRYCSINDLKFS